MEEQEAGERGNGEGSRINGQKSSAKVRGLTWLDFGDATFPLFSARPVPASGSNVCVCFRMCFRVCFRVCFRMCMSVCFRVCFRMCFRVCFRVCFRMCMSECFRVCFRMCFRASFRMCIRVFSCVFSYVYESALHTKHPYSLPRTN